MRKLAVLVIGLAAMVAATTVPAAAPARDASDLFLRAYLQIQEGDAAFERADYSSAQGRYQDALTILKDVESVQPDWNPHIISFRQRYCEQRINESKVRLAGGTAPATKPSATTPTTIVTTPVITVPAASSRERDLSAEVERLRAQVQRMQIERGTAAPPVTAPPPRTAVTESDRVRQLETELSDMRRQVQQLVGDKSATPPPATMPSGDSQKVMELTDQMGTLRSQLQQLLAERTQWEQSRQELARLQTERSSLLRQLQEKDQRLAAGPTVLESQQLKTTQEQLAQSARTIEAMRSESKQLSLKVAAAEHDARTQAAKVAELTPLSGQLATAKADADKLRIQIAEKDRQIADKSKALETKSLDLARAEDQFKELEKLRKQVAEKNLQIADKTKTLESKSLDLTSAQKNNAELQKTNAQMRIQLSKVEALASLTSGRYKESTEQVGQFKKQLQELKPKLTAAEKKNTKLQELINISGDREKLEQLDSLRHQLDELKPKLADAEKKKTDLQKQVDAAAGDREKLAQLDLLKRQLDELKPKLAEAERKNNELQKLAATATADREKLAQLDTLKRQLDEAERRVGDRTKERATLEKENAVLRATLDQKIAEAKKSSGGTDADRKKVAELEKELKDLKGQMTVLELGARKLSPAEEAFLKQTEVVVRPSQQAISGEISANLRAKERALAQFTALDDAQGIKRPPFVTLAQATSPASPVATDAGGAGGPLAGSAPLGSGQGSSAKMSPELKAYVDEARELYNQKKYEEAAAKYREVLKRDPDNLFGLSNLAVIRFQQERLEEAEHLLNRALQIAPDDGYSHSIIGIIYFKQDRLDDAIAELTRAIKLSPNNSEAHNFLGIACWRKGWRSAAEQELRRALELRPDYADAHYNLAVVYATQKPPFLGLAKFHYRKTLDLGRQRDPSLEKALTGEGGDAKPPEKKPADAKK